MQRCGRRLTGSQISKAGLALRARGENRRTPLDARQIRLMRIGSVASIVVALSLIVLKLWAWFSTDSVALLSSLADSLLDLLASMITFVAVRVAVEPPDREHRFGHGKSEGVAGIMQALIITLSAAFVAFRAISRLIQPVPIAAPGIGYAVMIVSFVLTGGLIALQSYVIRHTASLAISSDAAHYKADLLTNLAVIVAIYLSTQLGWLIADPILGLLIVMLIVVSVRSIASEAIDMLLDRELPTEERRKIAQLVTAHSAVFGVHDIRTRSAGAAQFIQFHIELDKRLTLAQAHMISDEVEEAVKGAFPAAEIIIHADPYGIEEKRDRF
jgi:ferrous-iron efflux pump FieF